MFIIIYNFIQILSVPNCFNGTWGADNICHCFNGYKVDATGKCTGELVKMSSYPKIAYAISMVQYMATRANSILVDRTFLFNSFSKFQCQPALPRPTTTARHAFARHRPSTTA